MAKERQITRTVHANLVEFIIINLETLEVNKYEDWFYGPEDAVEQQIMKYWVSDKDKLLKTTIEESEDWLLGMSEERFARLADRIYK